MYLPQLLLGIIVGVSASIPLGPIGVLCIQRTLNNNFKTGFISGLGAATADTIFAIVAMFFLSIVMSMIEAHMTIFSIVGGFIMTYLGVHIYRSRKKVVIRRNRKADRSLLKDYGSVLFLTIANPAFILVFVTLFAYFGVEENAVGFISPFISILGVTIGCSLWWFLLTFTVSLLRHKFRPRHILYINMVAGIVISSLGAAAITTAIIHHLN